MKYDPFTLIVLEIQEMQEYVDSSEFQSMDILYRKGFIDASLRIIRSAQLANHSVAATIGQIEDNFDDPAPEL